MLVVCNDCQHRYYDEIKSRVCPHPPIGVSPEDYCQKHDLIRQYQPDAFESFRCPTHEKAPTDIVDPADMREIADKLKAELRERGVEGVGFTLLFFNYGAGGNLQYISTADRTDMIAAMREFLQYQARSYGRTPN